MERAALALALALLLTACPEGADKGPTDPDDLTITTAELPIAVVGEAYSAGIDAEGGDGDYSWDVASGALPPGLDLSVEDLTDDDVLITGLPTQEGLFSFVLRVESEDGQTRTRNFQLEVQGEPEPISIETDVLPPALVGASYRTGLEANGGDGDFTWSVVGGGMPPGLTLTGDSIIGTATTADTTIVVLRVASGGFETEAAFTLYVVANRFGTFDVTALPIVPVPGSVQPSLDAALARWQDVISGDLSQAAIPGGFFDAGDCGGFGSILNGTSADDVIILVNITPIDGPSNVLGQAGPCVIRSSNGLPFAGVLTLDSDDLTNPSLTPQFVTDLISHEIAHVLGFGSLWDSHALLLGAGGSDPRFVGPDAVSEWQTLGGSGNVPVENTGGSGTANSHWREANFNTELMTGFAEQPGTPQPLSRVTIASLADMGYTVDLSAADLFALPAPMNTAAAALDRANAVGYDVVLRETIYTVDDAGRRSIFRPGGTR